jgi:hypothetical protein
MSTERAAFRAEVAEVERWWKVRSFSLSSLCFESRDPFVEPPLCPREAAIHSRRRRLEAWDALGVLSCQYRRQKGIHPIFRAL